jgi:hypothetical protein
VKPVRNRARHDEAGQTLLGQHGAQGRQASGVGREVGRRRLIFIHAGQAMRLISARQDPGIADSSRNFCLPVDFGNYISELRISHDLASNISVSMH